MQCNRLEQQTPAADSTEFTRQNLHRSVACTKRTAATVPLPHLTPCSSGGLMCVTNQHITYLHNDTSYLTNLWRKR